MSTIKHKIGTWCDWKFGLITRSIYRISEDEFEINDTSDGWKTAIVSKSTMEDLYTGKISLCSIEFS